MKLHTAHYFWLQILLFGSSEFSIFSGPLVLCVRGPFVCFPDVMTLGFGFSRFPVSVQISTCRRMVVLCCGRTAFPFASTSPPSVFQTSCCFGNRKQKSSGDEVGPRRTDPKNKILFFFLRFFDTFLRARKCRLTFCRSPRQKDFLYLEFARPYRVRMVSSI